MDKIEKRSKGSKVSAKNTGQTLMIGAAILLLANLLVKIIGAGFKIPLTYVLDQNGAGETAMGYFGTAYTVYTILFVISTAGFPVAIYKMVAEARARGNEAEAGKIFRLAFWALLIVGAIGTAIMYFTAKPFAVFLKNPPAYICIQAIAPAIFFVAILAAFRGYFQGRQNMLPTAISEVIESLGKLVFGLLLASLFIGMGAQYGAAGAVGGVAAGAAVAALVIFIIYIFHKKKLPQLRQSTSSAKTLMKRLLFLAIPVTLAAAAPHLINMLDTVTVVGRLQVPSGMAAEMIAKIRTLFGMGSREILTNVDSEMATTLYGRYSGYATPMFTLPLTLVAAIATSMVPSISASLALGKKGSAKSVVESVLRITMLFGLPCAVGLAVLASPILTTLYGNDNATSLLQLLGPAVLLGSFLAITNGILQAYGKAHLTIIGILLGGAAKLILNYTLIPVIGIDAAPIATTVSYMFTVGLNLYFTYKSAKPEMGLVDFLLKPIAAVVGMGIAAWHGYARILPRLGVKVSCIVAITFAGAVYGILLLVVRALRREDIEMLPKGEKLAKILGKFRLIK